MGVLQPGGWIKNKKDRYKPHECPRCGNIHTKQGLFCSLSCGNVREMTPTHRSRIAQTHISMAMIKDRETDTDTHIRQYGVLAAVNREAVKESGLRLTLDDLFLGIIKPKPIDDNQFVLDGDIWTEV